MINNCIAWIAFDLSFQASRQDRKLKSGFICCSGCFMNLFKVWIMMADRIDTSSMNDESKIKNNFIENIKIQSIWIFRTNSSVFIIPMHCVCYQLLCMNCIFGPSIGRYCISGRCKDPVICIVFQLKHFFFFCIYFQ